MDPGSSVPYSWGSVCVPGVLISGDPGQGRGRNPTPGLVISVKGLVGVAVGPGGGLVIVTVRF